MSWGLDCEDEYSSVSLEVYDRIYEDSFLVGGNKLQSFIMMMIDSVDDEFYLKLDLWEDIEYRWCTYLAGVEAMNSFSFEDVW
jgi:intracellular septation protein A